MRHKIWAVAFAGVMLFATTACAQQENHDTQTRLVEENETETYAVTTAEYDNIIQNVTIPCEYISREREDLAFSVDSHLITQVNIKMNDFVTKGQLLVSLDVEDLEERIEEQEYNISAMELQLKHTEEMKEFDLNSADTLYTYTRMTQKDKEDLKEKKENINKQYQSTLEDMEDRISIERQRLQQYHEELAQGCLYAGITGEITYLQNALEDTFSYKDRVVVTISDVDACYFTSDATKYAEYFEEGTSVNVFYRESGNAYECEVAPALMEQWNLDGQIYFKPVNEEILPIGTNGQITIELERKENVLCIPVQALHESDKGPFVYLVNDGLLEMRYVTFGLKGDTLVEITDGLEQGETVVIKK